MGLQEKAGDHGPRRGRDPEAHRRLSMRQVCFCNDRGPFSGQEPRLRSRKACWAATRLPKQRRLQQAESVDSLCFSWEALQVHLGTLQFGQARRCKYDLTVAFTNENPVGSSFGSAACIGDRRSST